MNAYQLQIALGKHHTNHQPAFEETNMKDLARLLAALLFACFAVGACAQSLDEAKAMVESALAHHKAVGHEAAMNDFVEGNPQWHKGLTMYLVAVQYDGQMLAHTMNRKIVGKNMLEARDAQGKPFIQEIIRSIKATGSATVEAAWTNPQTKKIDDAVVYAKQLNGMDAYVGVMFFKNK
jgi:methyl-accepting chemotaxis protein